MLVKVLVVLCIVNIALNVWILIMLYKVRMQQRRHAGRTLSREDYFGRKRL